MSSASFAASTAAVNAVKAGKSIAKGEASAWKVDFDKTTAGNVEFRATGRPSAMKIVGKGTAPRGNVTWDGSNAAGTLVFDMKSLDTGMDLRNKHMKEKYLEVEKFPEAKLTLTKVALPKEASQQSNFSYDGIPFEGKLQLHGVEKPVAGKAKLDRKDGALTLLATFPLKMTEYAIAVPSFAGITVAEDVEVSVQDTAPMLKAQ